MYRTGKQAKDGGVAKGVKKGVHGFRTPLSFLCVVTLVVSPRGKYHGNPSIVISLYKMFAFEKKRKQKKRQSKKHRMLYRAHFGL